MVLIILIGSERDDKLMYYVTVTDFRTDDYSDSSSALEFSISYDVNDIIIMRASVGI